MTMWSKPQRPGGVERLNEQPFDLLLTDWNMPQMSGLELLQKVRGTPDMAPLPVVMLTTRDNKEDIVSAVKVGINNYVTKPCKPTQLKDKIVKALIHAVKKHPSQPPSVQHRADGAGAWVWERRLRQVFNLQYRWTMYAPSPPAYNGWCVCVGRTLSGAWAASTGFGNPIRRATCRMRATRLRPSG